MRTLLIFLLFFTILNCKQNSNHSNDSIESLPNPYNTFDEHDHLSPPFDKLQFDTLHGWNFGIAILRPIDISEGEEDEKQLSKRLSPGQKALYFIWYLDDDVTNGGFIQFYWSGNRKYLPPIIGGLELIGDTSMIGLVNKVDKEYLVNKEKFDSQRQKGDWGPLYSSLKEFDRYDSIYYATHDKTMQLIERFARQNPNDFVKFK